MDFAQENAEMLKQMEDAAKSLKESLLSPLEAFQKKQEELKGLADAGLINQTEMKQALQQALPDEIKKRLEKSLSPIEEFQQKLAEAKSFLAAGAISQADFDTIQDNLKKEFGMVQTEVKFAGTAELGSQEARNAILRNRFQQPRNNEPLKNIEKQGHEGNKLLSQIARNTKSSTGDEIFSLN